MSRFLSDLESALDGLLAEHRALLDQVVRHEAAVRAFDLKAMANLAIEQEAIRHRLICWDNRRRAALAQLARTARISPDITLSRLAELFPPRRAALLRLRDDLRSVIEQTTARAKITGRIASAVTSHLTTAVRLIAAATDNAVVYTRTGAAGVSRRVGILEAFG